MPKRKRTSGELQEITQELRQEVKKARLESDPSIQKHDTWLAEQKAKGQQDLAVLQRIHKNERRRKEYATYQDFASIFMAIVVESEEISKLVQAYKQAIAPALFYRAVRKVFTEAKKPLNWINDRLGKDPNFFVDKMTQSMHVTLDNGKLSSDVIIHGKSSDNQALKDSFHELVGYFLQDSGYEVTPEGKILYKEPHPNHGEPISEDDFKKVVQQDDYLGLREYLKSLHNMDEELAEKIDAPASPRLGA